MKKALLALLALLLSFSLFACTPEETPGEKPGQTPSGPEIPEEIQGTDTPYVDVPLG